MTAEARVVAPGVTVTGNAATGTGDAQGRPLPTEEHETADIFERLESGRQRKAIRSPIVLQGPSPQPTPAQRAERASDVARFAAPPPTAASYDDMTEDLTTRRTRRIRVDNPADRTEAETATPQVTPVVPVDTTVDHMPPCPVERCGQTLTGGGAPRGWILVRIVGAGTPRRYCSATCAAEAMFAATGPPRQHRERRPWSDDEISDIVHRYQAGQTPPQIGKALGRTAKRIRDALDRAGVQRRDDRTLHSGSDPKEYDPELVARVRRLYTLHELTQDEVAHAIGTSAKVVQNVMARHSIPARPPASVAGHGHAVPNPAQSAADRLRALGVTSRAVKVWAHERGLLDEVQRGVCPAHVIDAYIEAHPEGATA